MTIQDLIKFYKWHKIQLKDKKGNEVSYARLTTKILGFEECGDTLYVTINW